MFPIGSTAVGNHNTMGFRRPHGVAVHNIGEMVSSVTSSAEEKEFVFKVFQGEDKDFHQLHDLIIRKQTSKYNPLSSQHNYGMLKLFIIIIFFSEFA